MATNKKVRKANNKIDFKDSVKAIRETAKTVNKKVKNVREEVAEDLVENTENFRTFAMENAKTVYKRAYDSVTETVSLENISKTVKEVNNYTLKTADEVVEGVFENSEKMQEIAAKAVKGGLKLAAKQQDIIFDTLETVKGQLVVTGKRFKKLFSSN